MVKFSILPRPMEAQSSVFMDQSFGRYSQRVGPIHRLKREYYSAYMNYNQVLQGVFEKTQEYIKKFTFLVIQEDRQ